MSDIFLSRVTLSDFRVYGDYYAFDLDPAPGVTLVVGPNGLGKTTFFDGIEWALTGRVSRLEEVPGDGRRKEPSPLTRLGRPEGSHRVSLEFSEGPPVDRGLGFTTDEAAIKELLRRPDWPEIGHLDRYLSITHFLGQASTQRFFVRDRKAQWDALRGPAGVDRINFIMNRIGGLGPRRAFNRLIEERSKGVSDAEAALKAWEDLLTERDQLGQLASSEEAVEPEGVVRTANEIAARAAEFSLAASWRNAVNGDPAEAVLGRVAAFLADIRADIEARRTKAGELKRIADGYLAAAAETEGARKLVSDAEGRRAQATAAATALQNKVEEATARLAPAERRLSAAQSHIASLGRAAGAAEQLAVAEKGLRETTQALNASQTATEAAASRQSELTQAIADAAVRIETRAQLTAQLAQARVRRDLSDRCRAMDAEVERLRALASADELEDLRARRLDFIQSREERRREIAVTEEGLRALDDRQANLASAVALIAAHLTEHDDACPVCATGFPPGRLLRLAASPRPDRDASAQSLATELAELRLKEAELSASLTALETSIERAVTTRGQLTEAQTGAAGLRQELAAAGAPDGPQSEDLLAATIEELQAQLRRLDAEIEGGTSLEDLQAAAIQAASELDAEATRRASLRRQEAEHRTSADAARGVLRQTPALWDEEAGFKVDLENARGMADEELKAASEALAAAQEDLRNRLLEAEQRRQLLTAETAAAEAAGGRLSVATELRDGFAQRWREAAMSGDPDPARVIPETEAAEKHASQLAALIVRQRQLTTAYRRWLDDQRLREAQRRVASALGAAATENERTDELRKSITDANSALRRAQAAQARMNDLVSGMKDKADAYAEGVLDPLNDIINRFSRTLMTWSDGAIAYRAQHFAAGAELRPETVRIEPDGEVTPLGINPNHYFSEGQLSALSVSALLAASTSFGWSRWPALLMDDPLQHNDVIHASAFMDLMRQLVRRKGYQVILSTHDSSEAEFLTRKCRDAGIPHRVHELAPPGEEGLVSRAA